MKKIGLILLCLWAFSCRSPKEADLSGVRFTAYVGVTVIDGKGNPPQENQTVLIQEKEIVRIGPRKGFKYPPNTRKVNVQGKYLIPGLIDMHAHVTILPLAEDGGLEQEYDLEASLASLQTYLKYGITTVRNPAAPTRDGVFLRALSEEDTTYLGPRIFTAGAALNRTKSNFGPFVATPSPKAIEFEIQQQAEAGVDFIKIYGSLRPRQTRVAIEAAHNEGLEVIGHLQNTSWTDAIKMGIDAITHAAPWHRSYLPKEMRSSYRPDFLGRLDWLEHVDQEGEEIQEMIRLLADSQVVIDPTLLAFHTKFWGDDSAYTHGPDTSLVHPKILDVWRAGTFVDGWTEEDFGRAKTLWPNLLALTKGMYEAGCLLTIGTDFPNPWVLPGKGVMQEMRLFEDAGIPKLDILKAATYDAAKALRINHKLGAIAAGLEADFLILEENPLEDWENLESLELVVKRGVEYDPEDL